MSSGVWRVPSFDRGNKAVERISDPLFPWSPRSDGSSRTQHDTQQSGADGKIFSPGFESYAVKPGGN